MNKGHAATFAAAALLASTTAFAQGTTTTSSTTTGQKMDSPAQPVTLIGCVQKESEYRKAHNIKRGGGLNTGLGDGNEYILINAVRVSPGSAPAGMSGDCTSASSGEAFEITGSHEGEFKAFVGQRVEVSGKQKRARVAGGRPTGGNDPMNGDLKLFEVEVSSVKEAAVMTAQVETPAPATTAPAATEPAVTAPAPVVTAPAPEPVPTATAGQAEPARTQTSSLPHTASPLPLFELSSLLAFAGAYGVRRLRRQ